MTRRRALAVLLLVLGGLVAISLATVFGSTETSPARRAEVQSAGHSLDIWRVNATGQLIFQWTGEPEGTATRYLPAPPALVELKAGRVRSVRRFASRAAAWKRLHLLYGLTRGQVRAALAGGSPSSLPLAGKVRLSTTVRR